MVILHDVTCCPPQRIDLCREYTEVGSGRPQVKTSLYHAARLLCMWWGLQSCQLTVT